MCIEKKDGSIWMLIRARGGIGEATSYDKGYTWTNEKDSGIGGPCARFCIRRLKSGRMLLINHHDFVGRNNLKAMVSEDEGATWKGFLLLDERTPVTYPDMTEDNDGNIYVTYDFGRYEEREILMAKITEADILAGEIVTPSSYLKRVVNRATGERAVYEKIENKT
jgi:predicted neuraminidase